MTGTLRERIIVALDTDAHEAFELARQLEGVVRWVKVGMTLYYAEGPDVVRRLKGSGFEVFLDLKLHDIPHQVQGAAAEIARVGAGMFTVHAAGGERMVAAAVDASRRTAAESGLEPPAVLAVTVLTSMDQATLGSVGVSGHVEDQVRRLATLAANAGADGVVCSPNEASLAREVLGPEALVVTPGVRPAGSSLDDQSRVATPQEAIDRGASHLVIGRPITGDPMPAAAARRIIEEG